MNRSTKYAFILPKREEASSSQLDEGVTELSHPSPAHEPPSESQFELLHMEMSDIDPEEYKYQYAFQPPDEGFDSFLLSSPSPLETEGRVRDDSGESLNFNGLTSSNDLQGDLLLDPQILSSSILNIPDLDPRASYELFESDLIDLKDPDELPNDTLPDPISQKNTIQPPPPIGISLSEGYPSLYNSTPPSQTNLEIYKFDQLGRQPRNDRLNSRLNKDLRCYMQAPVWAAELTGGGGLTPKMSSSSKMYNTSQPIVTFTSTRDLSDFGQVQGEGQLSISRKDGLGWLNGHKTYFTLNLSQCFCLKKYRRASGSTEKARMDRSSSLAPVITTALSWAFTRFLQVHCPPLKDGGEWTGEKLDDQTDSIRPILHLGTARILEAWNEVRINDEELIISKIDAKNVDASRRVAREKVEGRYVPTKRSILYEGDGKAKQGKEQGEGKNKMEVS
ncbi:uncharacterized protein L199_003632 [Kwoniella botswanensis]|uniref:uncharacterized protein n=1 Tax=Kwoniella botswanensis TaxID=1268659 RepID=UPI00315D4139